MHRLCWTIPVWINPDLFFLFLIPFFHLFTTPSLLSCLVLKRCTQNLAWHCVHDLLCTEVVSKSVILNTWNPYQCAPSPLCHQPVGAVWHNARGSHFPEVPLGRGENVSRLLCPVLLFQGCLVSKCMDSCMRVKGSLFFSPCSWSLPAAVLPC